MEETMIVVYHHFKHFIAQMTNQLTKKINNILSNKQNDVFLPIEDFWHGLWECRDISLLQFLWPTDAFFYQNAKTSSLLWSLFDGFFFKPVISIQ